MRANFDEITEDTYAKLSLADRVRFSHYRLNENSTEVAHTLWSTNEKSIKFALYQHANLKKCAKALGVPVKAVKQARLLDDKSSEQKKQYKMRINHELVQRLAKWLIANGQDQASAMKLIRASENNSPLTGKQVQVAWQNSGLFHRELQKQFSDVEISELFAIPTTYDPNYDYQRRQP